MTQTILILLCLLVIFSYLFDLFARQTKVPSVLMLMLLGIGLRYAVEYFNAPTFDLLRILPALGTIGLILIVFEGALELTYDKSKNGLIKKAFLSASVILLASTFGVALIIRFFTNESFYLCFVNAIPFSIISSAVAIPSVANIDKGKREFIIYESTLSDILGIIFFNFFWVNTSFDPVSVLKLGGDILLMLVISAVSCLALLYILGKITHHVKFFLIIAILVLIYAIGKEFHLSSLIIVLAFGLFLSNAGQINLQSFKDTFLYPNFKNDLNQMFHISAESAFLIRTFFFIIFGFVMNADELGNGTLIEFGLFILLATYAIRLLFLKFMIRSDLTPEVFITPRGLISILLFFSLPERLKIAEVDESLLFIVILGTSIVMTLGLIGAKKTA